MFVMMLHITLQDTSPLLGMRDALLTAHPIASQAAAFCQSISSALPVCGTHDLLGYRNGQILSVSAQLLMTTCRRTSALVSFAASDGFSCLSLTFCISFACSRLRSSICSAGDGQLLADYTAQMFSNLHLPREGNCVSVMMRMIQMIGRGGENELLSPPFSHLPEQLLP